MLEILDYLKARYMSEKAQGMTEYAIIVAVVVLVGLALYNGVNNENGGLAESINGVFERISNTLDNILKDTQA